MLSHSFFSLLNLVLLSQVPENQPAYKNQTELQKHVVFSTNKKYNPAAWRFWCYRNCFRFCSSFRALSSVEILFREQTSRQEETGWGSSNCVELFKQWAACFVFVLFFFSLLAIPFIIFPSLGNGLKPVLELAVVYSGGKLKKLDEIRLGSLELPLMCLFIHLRKVRLNGLICSK